MKQTILIVEDEREICDDLSKILGLSGFDTQVAYDGNEGLKLAFEHCPDLIISDILLPVKSGYELLRELQVNPETASIPFLFLSAKSNKFDVREAMNLGADDFITKPYDIDELLGIIKIRLEKKIKRESHLSQKIENLQTNLRKTMPHEIRTPLNVILGFSEFLMKNNKNIPNDEALEMISNIHESGQRLQRTFENYLLFANLELISASQIEKIKFQKYKTYMVDLFMKEIALSKAEEHDRLGDLRTDLAGACVNIYEEHFRKITEELIDNSFKFSDKGTEVSVESSIDNNLFQIVISDYGRGMSTNQLSNLGDYVQFERTMYEQQGTGLGLSIVKKIVDIYNGTMTISSKPNAYTVITVNLPGKEDFS